jgi:Hemerythrin HHE cation binding domain
MAHDDNSLADTRLLQAVHKTFRVATTRMTEATAKLEPAALRPAIGPYWTFFHVMLEYHHHTEDHEDFPILTRYYPDIEPLIGDLGQEHLKMVGVMEEIDGAVRAFEQSPDVAGRDRINAGAVELRDLFFPHLDREDAEVLPMFAKWIPPKEWEEMDTKALRSIPKPQLPFAVGALDETIRSLPPTDQPSGPPLPVRMMLALSWRKKWATLVQPLLV